MPNPPRHLRPMPRRRAPAVLAACGLVVVVATSTGVAARAASSTTTTTAAASPTSKASTTTRVATTKAKATPTKRSTATTDSTAATTTTTAPPPASTTPADAPPSGPAVGSDGLEHVAPAALIDGGPKGLASGSKGEPVRLLEQRLTDLRFDPVNVDGTYDARTALAVMAFQKQQGLPRSGKADPATLAKLATADLGSAFTPTGEPTRVEVDLPHQIAQFWKDGKLLRVLAVSTGSGVHYCVPADKGGGCDVAITPGGSYRADRKIKGDRESKLGHLFDPVYFNGGIAIHGSGSIPASPASHGCIRVAMWESKWSFEHIGIGDPVYVTGGKITAVPFADTAPTEAGDAVTTDAPVATAPVPDGIPG